MARFSDHPRRSTSSDVPTRLIRLGEAFGPMRSDMGQHSGPAGRLRERLKTTAVLLLCLVLALMAAGLIYVDIVVFSTYRG